MKIVNKPFSNQSSQTLQIFRLLYLITCFIIPRAICDNWHVFSQEFVDSNSRIDNWVKIGDGQLLITKNTGCQNFYALGQDFFETTISKQYQNLPINRGIRVSLKVNTYGFDDNEKCILSFGEISQTLQNHNQKCDIPFTFEDKSGIKQFNFQMRCEGGRNIFEPEVWAIYHFKVEYLCKRDECDDCNYTEECICNSLRQFSFQQNMCVDVCQNGFILDTSNSNSTPCQQCQPWCKKCNTQDKNECFQCQEDGKYIKINSKICGDCEEDEIPIFQFCNKCHSDCKSCFGLQNNQCIECKNNQQYIQQYNNNLCGTCDVNNGYFIVQNKCKKCDKSCKKCNGPNPNECTECFEQNFLNKLTSLCEQCHSDCKFCIGQQQTECIQCLNNSFNVGPENKICRKCYSNEFVVNYQCIVFPCPQACAQCSLTECIQCIPGEYFQFPSYKMCGQCQKNEYTDTISNQCRRCDLSCASCIGPFNTDCTSCSIGILQPDNTCSKKCPLRQYYEQSTNSCQDCIPDCLTCSNNIQCDTCEDGYYINQNKKCQQCHGSCQTCTGPFELNCSTCKTGKYYMI